MISDPLIMKGFSSTIIPLFTKSLLCLILKAHEKPKTKFKLGKGWGKVSLKFALDFLPHFCFAPSQSSYPADDGFKPFNEPGGCSPALANLSRNLDGLQSPTQEGQKAGIPLQIHRLLMLLLPSILQLVQKGNYMDITAKRTSTSW